MTIFFDSNHFNTIIYTKQCCVPCFVANKPSLNHFMRESVKNAQKTSKRNLTLNFKHMTISFNSKHFNTIIYTKQCYVPSFVPHKPSLNDFKVPKTLKKPQKCNIARNFKHMTIVFDSIDLKTIIYTKQCCVPSFVANKLSLNHFVRESSKNA